MTTLISNYSRIEAHYRANFSRLTKFVYRFAGSFHNAEDIVQEAYTRALTFQHSAPTEDDSFGAWFNTILHNCIRDRWRIENLQGMSNGTEEVEEQAIEPAVIPQIIYSQVVDRINKKPPALANILRLALVEQYTPMEIAQQVDATSNAVRQLVHNFRQEVRAEFRWVL